MSQVCCCLGRVHSIYDVPRPSAPKVTLGSLGTFFLKKIYFLKKFLKFFKRFPKKKKSYPYLRKLTKCQFSIQVFSVRPTESQNLANVLREKLAMCLRLSYLCKNICQSNFPLRGYPSRARRQESPFLGITRIGKLFQSIILDRRLAHF